MSSSHLCPECHAQFPSGVLNGLCPACLLRRGMGESASEPSAPFSPPDLAEIARLFPQLEILSLLGKGGMGAVYKARQPALDRFVALKILAPQAAGGQGFETRFSREARALARLSHPAIVGVYEFGETGGLHYFLMEYVDGANLRHLLKGGHLSSRDALHIVPQICDALQYAHDEGVVHRDIKPENVLIDRKGRVKIADFGLAKILGLSPEALRLTGEGHIMGTPHYMAPEQFEHPLEVDHRADIYSLGVVFYELLTGELPIGKFAAPSQKVSIDVRLDEVVLRALEKEPEHRYSRAGEMKTEVETISQTRGDGAPAPTGSPVVSKAVNSPRFTLQKAALLVLAIIGTILILAFIAGVVGLAIPAVQKRRAASEQVRARQAEMAAEAVRALPQGAIELLSISQHPATGKSGWQPDGAPFEGPAFQNESSTAGPDPARLAYEFVFRTKGLPADASSPTWKFSPIANWAGGGMPSQGGEPLPEHHVVTASLPKELRELTVSAGIAMGAWTTITEQDPTREGMMSTTQNGVNWSVSFLPALEQSSGKVVVNASYTPAEQETRIIAIDRAGREHTSARRGGTGTAGFTQMSVEFSDLPLAQIAVLRFQARPYRWVNFPNVALQPIAR